jgi:hypothetical protein
MTIEAKLKTLTNDQLIRLSEELRLPTVAEDALLREVIKGTDHDTTAPILAFIAVQGSLVFVLADRLIAAESDLALYNKHGYGIRELREIDEMNR